MKWDVLCNILPIASLLLSCHVKHQMQELALTLILTPKHP